MKIILLYLAKYKRRLLLGAACLVSSNILLLANPWILKIIIDSLKTGISRNRLLNLSLFFVGITVASGLFRFLMRRIMIGVSRKIEFDLRKEFFEHLEKLSPEFYLQNRTGDLMALATNDLNAVRALVGPGVMYSLNTIVVACLAVALMVILSIKLTVLALIPMALLSFAVYNSVKTIHKLFEKVQEKFAGLNSRSQENLSGIRVIKAFAREEHETDVFRKMSSSYVKQNMKLVKIQSLLMPMLTFVSGIGMLVILAYGGKLIIDGSLSLGAFVAFNGYLTMLIWPMIAIGWVMNITQRGLASMGRINHVLKTEPAITGPEDRGLEPERPQDKSIHFENVSFTYPSSPDRLPALDGISFTITQGETAAIVGPTGSGKSSLVLLLLRLFEPTQGGIFIGRTPLDRIPLEELRSLVGLVPQDIFLFSDTLRENIAFGAGSLSAEDLDKISSIAAIKDENRRFPGQVRHIDRGEGDKPVGRTKAEGCHSQVSG